jgi:hypothetical protein
LIAGHLLQGKAFVENFFSHRALAAGAEIHGTGGAMNNVAEALRSI